MEGSRAVSVPTRLYCPLGFQDKLDASFYPETEEIVSQFQDVICNHFPLKYLLARRKEILAFLLAKT